jgi:hypothetical protein
VRVGITRAILIVIVRLLAARVAARQDSLSFFDFGRFRREAAANGRVYVDGELFASVGTPGWL